MNSLYLQEVDKKCAAVMATCPICGYTSNVTALNARTPFELDDSKLIYHCPSCRWIAEVPVLIKK